MDPHSESQPFFANARARDVDAESESQSSVDSQPFQRFNMVPLFRWANLPSSSSEQANLEQGGAPKTLNELAASLVGMHCAGCGCLVCCGVTPNVKVNDSRNDFMDVDDDDDDDDHSTQPGVVLRGEQGGDLMIRVKQAALWCHKASRQQRQEAAHNSSLPHTITLALKNVVATLCASQSEGGREGVDLLEQVAEFCLHILCLLLRPNNSNSLHPSGGQGAVEDETTAQHFLEMDVQNICVSLMEVVSVLSNKIIGLSCVLLHMMLNVGSETSQSIRERLHTTKCARAILNTVSRTSLPWTSRVESLRLFTRIYGSSISTKHHILRQGLVTALKLLSEIREQSTIGPQTQEIDRVTCECWRQLLHCLQLQCQAQYAPVQPSFGTKGKRQSSSQSIEPPRLSTHPTLAAPSEYFVDLGVDPTNGAILKAIGTNHVTRFRLSTLRWTERLSFENIVRNGFNDKQLSTLLPCQDGFAREYWVTVRDLARTQKFFMRDVPTPQMWRNDIMKHLPLAAQQHSQFDIRSFVPEGERADNHDLNLGEGKFVSGFHIDEGKLAAVNGCAKGANCWYFVAPHMTQAFEQAVLSTFQDCDEVWAKHQPVVLQHVQIEKLIAQHPHLKGHVFGVTQERGEFLVVPSGWGHQITTEGSPTVNVVWALMPYCSLKQVTDCISEYRESKRLLIDNAGKATILGAWHTIKRFAGDEPTHLMTLDALLYALNKFVQKFNPDHQQIFVFRNQDLYECVDRSPYCCDCNTSFFHYFSCETTGGKKVNRCYECSLEIFGDNPHISDGQVIVDTSSRKKRVFECYGEFDPKQLSLPLLRDALAEAVNLGKSLWAKSQDESEDDIHRFAFTRNCHTSLVQ